MKPSHVSEGSPYAGDRLLELIDSLKIKVIDAFSKNMKIKMLKASDLFMVNWKIAYHSGVIGQRRFQTIKDEFYTSLKTIAIQQSEKYAREFFHMFIENFNTMKSNFGTNNLLPIIEIELSIDNFLEMIKCTIISCATMVQQKSNEDLTPFKYDVFLPISADVALENIAPLKAKAIHDISIVHHKLFWDKKDRITELTVTVSGVVLTIMSLIAPIVNDDLLWIGLGGCLFGFILVGTGIRLILKHIK